MLSHVEHSLGSLIDGESHDILLVALLTLWCRRNCDGVDGVFSSVNGVSGAIYKGYPSYDEAVYWFRRAYHVDAVAIVERGRTSKLHHHVSHIVLPADSW